MAEEKKVELKEESMEDVAGGCLLDSSKERGGLLDSSKELKRIVIDNKNEVLDRKKFERKIDLGSEDK